MKKSVKVALKRFLVLLICLVMVMSLFVGIKDLDNNVRIIAGIVCGTLIIIYWVYAIITIRREEQRKKKNNM